MPDDWSVSQCLMTAAGMIVYAALMCACGLAVVLTMQRITKWLKKKKT